MENLLAVNADGANINTGIDRGLGVKIKEGVKRAEIELL